MNLLNKTIVITSVFVFVIIFSSVSLLHKHKADFKAHDDCPAYILTSTLLSSLITFGGDFSFDLPIKNHSINSNVIPFISYEIHSVINNKSPPC